MSFPYLIWLSGGSNNTDPQNSLDGPRSEVLPKSAVAGRIRDGDPVGLPGVELVNANTNEDPGVYVTLSVDVELDTGTSEWVFAGSLNSVSFEARVPDDGGTHDIFLRPTSGTSFTAVSAILRANTTQLVDDPNDTVNLQLESTYGLDLDANKKLSGGLVTTTIPKFVKPLSYEAVCYGFPFNQIHGVTHVDAFGVELGDATVEDDVFGYRLKLTGSSMQVEFRFESEDPEEAPAQTVSTTGFYYFETTKAAVILYVDVDKLEVKDENTYFPVYLTQNTEYGFMSLPARVFPSQFTTGTYDVDFRGTYYFQNISSATKTIVAYLRSLPAGADTVSIRSKPEWLGDGITTGVVPVGYSENTSSDTGVQSVVDSEIYELPTPTPAGDCSGLVIYLRLVAPPPTVESDQSLDLSFGVA